jgi:dephospho-CoA kinase
MTRVIGITGGIGSGKSEVTGELLRLGYAVIDADEVAREVSASGSPAIEELAALFGSGIIGTDGALDRGVMSDIIFASPENMSRFNRVMKVAIGKRVDEKIAAHIAAYNDNEKLCFLSAALLYEAGWDEKCDMIWLVTADEAVRLRRAADRDGVPEEKIRERMSFQMPEAEKRERADAVIENNGARAELLEKIDELLRLCLCHRNIDLA